MQIKAFVLNNLGYNCYATCLPVIDILDRILIDEWGPNNRFGYQRSLDGRRFGNGRLSLVKGIEDGITNPSNIVVNTREKLVFNEESTTGNVGYGYLDVPDFVKFWVVDGRHKLESYKLLSKKNKEYLTSVLSLMIFDTDDIGFETKLFFNLNTSTLKLNKGIEYRNIQNIGRHYGTEHVIDHLGFDDLLTYRAVEITEILNLSKDSPFKDRICSYGSRFSKHHFVRDTEMISSLKMVLNKDILNSDLDKMALSLINYWTALKTIYLEGYEDGDKYSLFKYPGIYVFNMIFTDIEKKTTSSNEENYRRYLYKLKTGTEKHPHVMFKNPLNIELWDEKKGNDIFITRNPQILNFLYINLKRKLEL